LARVSIVNYNGFSIFDSYVKPTKRIVNFLTWVSGITPELIRNAPTLDEIKEKIYKLLKGKILVGHTINKDID